MSDGLIYAFYQGPKSTDQQAYTEQRLAQLAAQRREQQKLHSVCLTEHIEDLLSSSSTSTGDIRDQRHRHGSRGRDANKSSRNMEILMARTITTTSNASSRSMNSDRLLHRTTSEQHEQTVLRNPFELRHGRRYLRDVPYPLPVDLAEMQRQNLRTLLGTQVFGRVLCTPKFDEEAPKKVLELGCGTAYWTALCHEHFKAKGHEVEFVGLDIAPLASNLEKQGVKWKFVQDNSRRVPFPFEDGEFDLVMVKDLSLVMPLGPHSDKILAECIRILKPGGIIEVWESDHTIRSLLPNPPPLPSRKPREQEAAEETATFAIQPGHPFAPAQNKYIRKANGWISEALDRMKLHPTPCVRTAEMLTMEPDLEDLGFRRVAIPLGKLRWEKEAPRSKRVSNGHDSPMSVHSRHKPTSFTQILTPEQTSLRQTALMTVLQMIDSMEPMLREVSGKNSEEWSIWWAAMMADLTNPTKAALTGECLEMGAWWATKSISDDDDDDE